MRAIVVLTGAVAYYFALDEDSSLVQLLASAYGIISQLAPPVVAAMYWKRATTTGTMAGLVAGIATALFFYLNPEYKPFDMHEGVLALIVHVPTLIAVSLMTPRQDEEHLKGFFS
jgi:SSS family solute:Na+ symporter